MATKFTLLLFAIKIRLSCNQNKNFCFSTSGVNKGGARGGLCPSRFFAHPERKKEKGRKRRERGKKKKEEKGKKKGGKKAKTRKKEEKKRIK